MISNLCNQAIEQVYLAKWPVSVYCLNTSFDYECSLPESDVRASFSSSFFSWCRIRVIFSRA